MRIIAIALLAAACATAGRAADVAHGRRLAHVMGCVSCHGLRLDGHLFEEDPRVVLAWSSNLSRILPRWTDAQIATTLRTGWRPDGSALWFMPTFAHRQLIPADMADLVVWLRTVRPVGRLHPRLVMGPVFRERLAAGTMYDSAFQARKLAKVAPPPAPPPLARGRYLAILACAECHGPNLGGVPDPGPGDPPSLAVAGAYAPADLRRLLRTGVAAGGRKVGLMSEEAPKRLAWLTDAEIAAIGAYARSLTP